MDKSSSEQQFRKSDVITWQAGRQGGRQGGRQASRQSDKILVDLKFSTDKIVRIFTAFNEGTVLL